MKDNFLEKDKRRMDRFDAIITEYLRSRRKTVDYLAFEAGCDPSSLWRYRRQVKYFKKAPFDIVCCCLRLANASNEDIRYICGLPTGKRDEN